MKQQLLFCFFLMSGTALFAGEITPKTLDDWNGYALEHFLSAEDGVIRTKRGYAAIMSKATLRIQPGKTYVVRGEFRRLPGSGKKPLTLSFGIVPCNAAGKQILNAQINPYPGTETELVRDAAAGEKVICLKDASKWHKKRWTVAAFGVKADGSDLPNDRMSAIITAVRRQQNGEWQVTFRTPLKQSYPKGCPVRQHFMTNKPFICAAANLVHELSGEWTAFSGEVSGILPPGEQTHAQFWHGTVSAGIRLFVKGNIEFRNIELKEK